MGQEEAEIGESHHAIAVVIERTVGREEGCHQPGEVAEPDDPVVVVVRVARGAETVFVPVALQGICDVHATVFSVGEVVVVGVADRLETREAARAVQT